MACVNPYEKLRITIVDQSADQRFDYFSARIDPLDKVVEVQLINAHLESRALPTALREASSEKAFSAVVFCLEDTQLSLLSYERYFALWSEAELAFYTPNSKQTEALMRAIEKKRGPFYCFGSDKAILTKHMIIDEVLMRRSIDFNAYYNRVAAELMGWPTETLSAPEQWQKLDTLKKESSMAQAMHRVVKLSILERVCQLPNYPDSVRELLNEWTAELEGLSTAEQVNLITRYPLKNYLTALEHRRWNNFHYMRNFVFAEEKNLELKQHDCLIDDWDEFLGSRQREKAIYDYLSVLSLTD